MANDAPYVTSIIILLVSAAAEIRLLHVDQRPLLQTKSKKKLHAIVESQKSTDTEDSDGEPLLVTDALKVHGISESMWLSTISVLGNKITFKLDTGAEASVLTLKVFNCLRDKPMLSNPTTKLSAYGGSLLTPIGTCVLECRGKFATSAVRFFVVSKEVQPILGLKDCTSLGLVQRVHTIQVPDLSKETIQVEFPDIFRGLGNIGKYRITLKENAIPVIHQARRVPHSLRDKLKLSLDANLKCGVLQKVDEPTDWVHNLVIVEKKNGILRLCLDPRDLNKVIKREHYRIPTAQEISSKLAGKKVFSTFDQKDGYWQVELDNYSSMLCTFSTPFGRYRFTRIPFGLASASEVFQKKNEAAFDGIDGVHIVADDIIIAAANVEEHDMILRQVLARAQDRNVKFNFDKLQLRVNSVKYLGTIVTDEGIKPDPAKVSAIVNMPGPTDKATLRRLLGMVNFLSSHIPNLATITAPLRALLKLDTHFLWTHEHNSAFEKLKALLSDSPILQYFDPTVRSVIQADASQHGLRACLLQRGQPIAYASRRLSDTECNYA